VDDSSLSNLLETELKESGFYVKHVPSVKSAIDTLTNFYPDVVVLDIMLEDEGGWELLKYMKNKEEYKKILFISSALEEKNRAIELGAIEYLMKPYPPSRLSKIIMQTLLNQGQKGQIMIPEEK
jgi:DNA-binding response OmpR family regulator